MKVVALCLKLKEWLKSNRRCKVSKKESLYDSVTIIDILDAEREVVRLIQQDCFSNQKESFNRP